MIWPNVRSQSIFVVEPRWIYMVLFGLQLIVSSSSSLWCSECFWNLQLYLDLQHHSYKNFPQIALKWHLLITVSWETFTVRLERELNEALWSPLGQKTELPEWEIKTGSLGREKRERRRRPLSSSHMWTLPTELQFLISSACLITASDRGIDHFLNCALGGTPHPCLWIALALLFHPSPFICWCWRYMQRRRLSKNTSF